MPASTIFFSVSSGIGSGFKLRIARVEYIISKISCSAISVPLRCYVFHFISLKPESHQRQLSDARASLVTCSEQFSVLIQKLWMSFNEVFAMQLLFIGQRRWEFYLTASPTREPQLA